MLLAALLYAVVAGWRSRSGLEPPADPWLTSALVLLGAWLLLGALMTTARARVSAATLRREPDLPVVLDAADLSGAPVGNGPAWSDPQTPAGWRAGLPRAWWPLVAAVVLALGVGLSARVHAASDDNLARTGIRTAARVDGSGWSFAGRGGRPVANVQYAYATRPYTATVTGPLPGTTPRGAQLSILVDPEQPHHVRAENHPATSTGFEWWLTLGSLAALGLAALGVLRLLRHYGWRRALRAGPWLEGTVGLGPQSARRPVLVTTAGARTTASGAVPGDAGEHPALVLPGTGRHVLVQVDGRLAEVRLPATAVEGRRWARALDATGPAASPAEATATH